MSPLDKQIVEMPFGMGLETKQDPFQIPLGKLIAMANGVFTTPGRLSLRNGFTPLPQTILGGGNVANPVALFGRGNELLQIGGQDPKLYSYSSAESAWINKGLMPSIITTTQSAAQPQYSTYSIDVAQAANGLQCFVYELVDTSTTLIAKGLGYTVFDPNTGQIVIPPTVFESSTTAGNPHVIVLGGNFVCYYVIGVIGAGGNILGRSLPAANVSGGWTASSTLTSGGGTLALSLAQFPFDVVADATAANAYLMFRNLAGTLTVSQILSANPLAFHTVVDLGVGGGTPNICMDQNGNVLAAWNAGIAIQFTALAAVTLATVKAATTITPAGSSVGSALTCVSTAPGEFTVFCSAAPSTASCSLTTSRISGTNYGTIVFGGNPFIRGLGIAAKAFQVFGIPYLPCWYSFNASGGGLTRFQTPQNQIILINATGRVMAKALVGTAGGFDTTSLFNLGLSAVYQLGASVIDPQSSSIVHIPSANTNILADSIQNFRAGGTPSSGTTPLLFNYNFGASAVTFSFGDATSYQRSELANEVHVNGGILQMYDGQQCVEHGFTVFPPFIDVSTGAGGALGAGSYAVCATYEWMDGQGQVHRSTPSAAVTFTATAGQEATYVVPNLALTAKTGVVIQIYRTIVNGSIFFQITNFNQSGSLFNNPNVDIQTWVDTQSDVAIQGNPQLYTAQSVENDPAPAVGAMTSHRNRLFVVDSNNPLQIWPSKQVVTPAPVEFSGLFVLNVTPDGGKITALASLDDKLIAFKAGRIYMFLGQGPDALGNQNDFTDAILVTSDTGCSVPKSIVLTNDGLMFQSPKGIYRLSRALQAIYIGAPVEGIIDSGNVAHDVTSGAMMSETNQVRFGVNKGTGKPGLVAYDYLVDQWGTSVIDSNTAAPDSLDATVVNGNYYNLFNYSSLGAGTLGVAVEADGSVTDPRGQAFMSFTTGWIKVGGLQRFQRAYKLQILGVTGGGKISVSIAYDNEPTAMQTTVVRPIPSAAGTFQVSIGLVRQKCQALQITVQDLEGNLFSVSGLALEIGVKKGTNKLPATKRFG